MKKTILQITFLFIFSLSGIQQTHAAAIWGATEWTQIGNNIQLYLGNSTALTTATEQTLSTTKEVILDPVGNALIASAQQQAANSIVAWAKGGFQGNPLVISNLQNYIKNQGINSLKITLGGVPTGSIYGNSILNTVINSVRTGDTQAQIAALSNSSLPSLVQKNFCNEDSLNQTAMNDVSASDGSYNNADFTARKAELYKTLCSGDPKTDPVLAKSLNTLASNQPSFGNGDVWLATTGGNNEFNVTSRAVIATKEAQRVAEEAAKANVTGGVASETTCVNEVTDINGDKNCKETAVLTPSGTVQNTISNAVNSGLNRLTNIQGSGALSSLITGLAVKYITEGLNSSVSKPTPSQTSTITTKYTQDFLNNPQAKDSLVKPMRTQFNAYLSTLDKLDPIDTAYLLDINAYESRINAVKTCIDNLQSSSTSYMSLQDSSLASDFSAFYASRKPTIDSKRNELLTEKGNISSSRDLVNTTMSLIDKANSSQEIYNIYTSYSDKTQTANFIALNADIQRAGDYRNTKYQSDNDTVLASLSSRCATASNQGNGGR